MAHDAGMRIQFAPPPKPVEPKTSWPSVFALAFVMVWAAMLALVMIGPGQPPLERFVAAIAQEWRQTQPQVQQPPAGGEQPPLRASVYSRARNTAILGARQRY